MKKQHEPKQPPLFIPIDRHNNQVDRGSPLTNAWVINPDMLPLHRGRCGEISQPREVVAFYTLTAETFSDWPPN